LSDDLDKIWDSIVNIPIIILPDEKITNIHEASKEDKANWIRTLDEDFKKVILKFRAVIDSPLEKMVRPTRDSCESRGEGQKPRRP